MTARPFQFSTDCRGCGMRLTADGESIGEAEKRFADLKESHRSCLKDERPANPFICADSCATLRDLFAAFALDGILSDSESLVVLARLDQAGAGATHALAAQSAFMFADAMLAERSKR